MKRISKVAAIFAALLAASTANAAQPSTANFVKYGERLQINGDLTPAFVEAMQKVLDGNPLVGAVELNSKGEGDIAAARALRDFIQAKGFNTFVDEECSALCTVVFLGGKRRVVTETAKLGFSSFRENNDALRREEVALGVSDAFLQKTMAASDTSYPSPDDLLGAGVVTDVIPAGDEPRF
jgi:hypothetical protein